MHHLGTDIPLLWDEKPSTRAQNGCSKKIWLDLFAHVPTCQQMQQKFYCPKSVKGRDRGTYYNCCNPVGTFNLFGSSNSATNLLQKIWEMWGCFHCEHRLIIIFLRVWTVTQVSHMALGPQENNLVHVSNRKLINRNTGPSPCHTQQPTSLQQVKALGEKSTCKPQHRRC